VSDGGFHKDVEGDATDLGPPPEPDWQRIPLGARGDLHRVRFFVGPGFFALGDDGTILRGGDGRWVREHVASGTPALRDVTLFAGELHAAGEAGTWLVRDPAGVWHSRDPGVIVDLYGAVALQDVIVAVGDKGVIVRMDSKGGFAQEPSGVSLTLHGVAEAGPTSAFAVGDAGVAVRRIATPTPCVEGPDDLCNPCSEAGDCAGGACETMPGEEELRCTRPCGLDAQACPEGFHCTDSDEGGHCVPGPTHGWVAFQASSGNVRLRDVFALDARNLWAVGDEGSILHFTGQWKKELSNDASKHGLYGVTGGGGLLLAVGEEGTFLTRRPSGTWALLDDVKGPLLAQRSYGGVAVGAGLAVAAGAGGALQRKELPDGAFFDAESRPKGALRDVAFRGDSGIAAGDGGLLVVVDEGGYGALLSGTAEDLLGVCVGASGARYAAGREGTLLRYRAGEAVAALSVPTPADLYAVLELDDGSVIAAGQAGTILRYSAGSAEPSLEPTPGSMDLHDVFEAPDGLVAVGEQGTVWSDEGGAWSPVTVPTSFDLFAGAHAGGRSVVAGAGGVVLFWPDGEEPRRLAWHRTVDLHAVEIAEDGSALIAGWAGTLLRLGVSDELEALHSPTSRTIYAAASRGDETVLAGDGGELWTFALKGW